MDAEQAYLFDLQGFLHLPNVLKPSTISTLLSTTRTNKPDDSPPRDPATGEPLEGRGPKLRAAHDTLHWGRDFRELVAHPRVAPILEELCGQRYRLDHVGDLLRPSLLNHAADALPKSLTDAWARRSASTPAQGSLRAASGMATTTTSPAAGTAFSSAATRSSRPSALRLPPTHTRHHHHLRYGAPWSCC